MEVMQMANIQEYLNNIKNAIFGKDVRSSIHDGINAINNEVISNTTLTNNTKVRQDLLEDKYDAQIAELANEEPQLPEIVDARSGFDTLGNVISKKTYHFNTIAEMKACNKLKNGDCVQTLGYYSASDGGSGTYQIVNDSTLVDDGGSVHDIINGLKAKLIIKDSINVKQFGAYGDGVHNDTNAIQKAIELNPEKYAVLIPEATFLITQLKVVNYVKIKGINCRTSILTSATASSMIIFKYDGCKGFHIKDLQLDGQNTATKGYYFTNQESQAADTFGIMENIIVRRTKTAGIELGTYIREMRITNAEIYGNKGTGLYLNGCSDSLFNFITSRSNDGIGFLINASDNRFVSCKAYINGTDNSPKVGFDVSNHRNIFVGCSSQQNTSHGVYLHDATNIIFDNYMGDSNGYLLSGVAPSTPSRAGLKMYNCNSIIINGFFGDFLNSVIGQIQKYGVQVESCYNYDIDIVCKSQVQNYSEASLSDYAQRSVKVNGTYYQQSQLNNISNDLLFIRKIISSSRETLSFRNENQGYDISLFNNDNSLKIDSYSGSNGNLTYQATPFRISGDKVVTGSTTSQIAFYGGGTVAKQTLTSNASDLETAISLVNDIKAKLIALNLFS
jgi:hypothetical protein